MNFIEKCKNSFNLRKLLLFILDAVVLVVAGLLVFVFFSKIDFFTRYSLITIMIFAAFGLLGMWLFRAYRNAYSLEYLGETIRYFAGYFIGEIVLFALYLLTGRFFYKINDAIPFLAICIIAGFFMLFAERIMYYIVFKKISYLVESRDYPPALIIGAGQAGQTVLSEIKRSHDHKFKVVGFVDDDPKKLSTYINGVMVYGPMLLIPELVEKYHVKHIIFAIPTCNEEDKERILKICRSTDCEIKVVPSLLDLNLNKNIIGQANKINVNDLLGRDVIKFASSPLADFINNRTVLVTGVGSIGSELCRQIAEFGPKRLIMVDIYENNAYDIQQELVRGGYAELLRTEIASVRDYDKMRELFAAYKPSLVFHAAAHKHVPLMEDNPEEAVKNNIFGTLNIARLSNEFGVDKMVLVSTDKAVNPTNVMGATKRCCEMIMQYMAQISNGTDFVAVRFGNVLGSNGSVIPLFTKQIENGGPVTVTHPDIIRYFMTIPEAVSLILECGTLAQGGEIFVLDMGEPVKITTLAENLIRLYGYEPYTEMPIKFTGLRPGEKLFEELLMNEEGLKQTENQKIFIGRQIEVDGKKFLTQLEALKASAEANEKENVVELLHEIVPTFKRSSAKPVNKNA
ncbi:MAG: polysaccharide biosynthesis protein [Clostridiales bacterium]|nr:polysaccharide biosynthesis protein [Candidatus Equinaster intestinalis]